MNGVWREGFLLTSVGALMAFQNQLQTVDLTIRYAYECDYEIDEEKPFDVAAREELLDVAMGSSRRHKSSERLREGNTPAPGLALVARDSRGLLIGTLRLWPIFAGEDRPALLLGPLAVAAQARCKGIGSSLMRKALRRARADGHRAVLLVGDAGYYKRFGFKQIWNSSLIFPGPVMHERFLGCELSPGALADAEGMVRAAVPNLSCESLRIAA